MVQDLYSKCWETFTKLIEHDINSWEHIPYLWVGRINIVIMTILPNQSTDSTQSLSKIPMAFFIEPKQIIIAKFVWKHKRPQTTKTILEKRTNQNIMVLAQKQRHRSMGQNRKFRNKSMHLWLINL